MKSAVHAALAATLLAASAVPALAGEYYLIHESETGLVALETGDAQRNGSKVKLWMLSVYADGGDDGIWRSATLVEFDCAARRDRPVEFINYNREGVVVSRSSKVGAYTSNAPDSVGAEMARVACATDRSKFDKLEGDVTASQIAQTYWTKGGPPAVLQVPPAPEYAAAPKPPSRTAPAAPQARGPLYVVGESDDLAMIGEVLPSAGSGPRRVEFAFIHREAQENGGHLLHYVADYDCRTQKDRIVAVSEYGKDRKRLFHDEGAAEWTPSEPGTLGVRMLAFACATDMSPYQRLGQDESALTWADAWWAAAPTGGSKAWGRSGSSRR